jgi:hypothetical protein
LLHLLVSLAQVLDLTPAELFDACTRKHRLNLPPPDPTLTAARKPANRRPSHDAGGGNPGPGRGRGR